MHSTRTAYKKPRAAPPSREKAIIKVDAEPIRNKLHKEYERVQKNVRLQQENLDRYHQQDIPNFRQWLHSTFGAQLTRVRELQELLHRLEIESFKKVGAPRKSPAPRRRTTKPQYPNQMPLF